MPKSAYWAKMCLLTGKMSIGRKNTYQKVSIERSYPFISDIQKGAY